MRDGIPFYATAIQEFHFLLDHGLQLTNFDDKIVEFEAESYSIIISWDRDGVTAGYRSKKYPGFGTTDIQLLVSMFDKQAADRLPVFLPAPSNEAAREHLKILGSTFRQFVNIADLSRPDFSDRIKAAGDDRMDALYPPVSRDVVSSRLRQFWNEKRYHDIVKHAVLREYMTSEEKGWLREARLALASESKPPRWWDEGLAHIWLPYSQMKTARPPLPAVRTEGSRIILADGRELIDGIASWWTAVHGYNHPHIQLAIEEQAARMPHVMLGGLIHEQAARLAARLAALAPGDLTRVFFSDSGSVAVEVAMKMAVQFWLNQGIRRRTKFVAFKGAYHGDTFATMAVCDPDEGMHTMFAGVLPEHHILDLPRDEETTAALDHYLAEDAEELAGIIVEPLVQGAGGMLFHSEQTLQRLLTLADKHGLLLICDEIFTGFGRTGAMFACEAAGIVPDIMTVGKGLTGGTLPLAATIASRKVFDAFWSDDPLHALMHGPTYMGNALACAAANASIDLFERENRLLAANEIGKQMAHELGPCLGLPGVKDVRTRGGIGVVELEQIDREDLKKRFLEEGVWIRPLRNVVYLTPALTIEKEELAVLTGAVRKVLNSLS